jgi:hypothetical protein
MGSIAFFYSIRQTVSRTKCNYFFKVKSESCHEESLYHQKIFFNGRSILQPQEVIPYFRTNDSPMEEPSHSEKSFLWTVLKIYSMINLIDIQ